jgi:hypothetical protein
MNNFDSEQNRKPWVLSWVRVLSMGLDTIEKPYEIIFQKEWQVGPAYMQHIRYA